MNLEIDYRERDIIELIKDKKEVNQIVCNLIIGDFIIKNQDNEILYAIERKSVKDLCASIIDGRFREQKDRLLQSIQDPAKIIYIIEGKKDTSQGITKNTINSSILNLIFKHQYKVIFSESKQDTVDIILSLCKKIINNELVMSINTLQPLKFIKKSKSLNDNIFINMLSAIPGVSINIAIKIKEKYNNMHYLINEYNNCDSKDYSYKMLSSIVITSKRKLGDVLSKKIYDALYDGINIDIDIESKKVICLL